MFKDKQKFKKELFEKYDIKLSDDDPFWLLMLMQKDMTSSILSATNKAQKSLLSINNFDFRQKFTFASAGFFGGVVLILVIMQITALFYKPKVKVSTPIVPLQKFVYRDKILYASDKDNRYLYTEEEMKNLPKKLLPDDNYISDNKGNHYIYIDRDDSRLQWGDSYLYIRVNNTKSFSKKDLKKDDKKYNSY